MAARRRTALVLGGAGFIGSHVVEGLVAGGSQVTVIDGLIDGTGGQRDNLQAVASEVRLIATPVEEVGQLADLVRDSDVVVDAMAWTSHLAALDAPEKDLRLNAASHLALVRHLTAQKPSRVVVLGSRGQYGNPGVDRITEDTPMQPEDIQGIHKVAAEGYYRIYARRWGLNVVSLRFPNCFGERQRTVGEDIGLVGGFIRSVLEGAPLSVYGNRRRAVVYAGDVARVVCRLADASFQGFLPLNMAGTEGSIEDLVRTLIQCAGRGSYRMLPLPAEVAQIDIGSAPVAEERLRDLIGEIPRTDLATALTATIRYFEGARA
jgi:UDP-glucose 4-epimerase